MVGAILALVLAQAPAASPRWNVAAAAEAARDRFQYHIENPSTYNTSELVPHFFEQTYDADNLWLGARIVHPFGSHQGRFELLATPQRTRRADDFDTFFQPDGNVVVTGTTGGASLRSWRLSERFPVLRVAGVQVDGEYSFRHHRARYHDGDGITTTTSPPSVSHRLVTTRETATSGLHEVWLRAHGARPAGSSRIAFEAGLSPTGIARLTVDLPDKYPGRLLVFYAAVSSISGGVAIERPLGGISIRGAVRAGRTFSWRSHSQLRAHTLTFSVDINPR